MQIDSNVEYGVQVFAYPRPIEQADSSLFLIHVCWQDGEALVALGTFEVVEGDDLPEKIASWLQEPRRHRFCWEMLQVIAG